MSEPGQPFNTKALDEMRSRQRRMVRELPHWTFSRATSNIPPLPETLAAAQDFGNPVDHQLLEAETRRLVDEVVDSQPPLAELVARLRRDGRIDPLLRLLNNRQLVSFGFDEMAQQAIDEAEQRVRQIPQDLLPTFNALVQLLVIADELADDPYKDPRLPT